jgi:hypothetical protein
MNSSFLSKYGKQTSNFETQETNTGFFSSSQRSQSSTEQTNKSTQDLAEFERENFTTTNMNTLITRNQTNTNTNTNANINNNNNNNISIDSASSKSASDPNQLSQQQTSKQLTFHNSIAKQTSQTLLQSQQKTMASVWLILLDSVSKFERCLENKNTFFPALNMLTKVLVQLAAATMQTNTANNSSSPSLTSLANLNKSTNLSIMQQQEKPTNQSLTPWLQKYFELLKSYCMNGMCVLCFVCLCELFVCCGGIYFALLVYLGSFPTYFFVSYFFPFDLFLAPHVAYQLQPLVNLVFHNDTNNAIIRLERTIFEMLKNRQTQGQQTQTQGQQTQAQAQIHINSPDFKIIYDTNSNDNELFSPNLSSAFLSVRKEETVCLFIYLFTIQI